MSIAIVGQRDMGEICWKMGELVEEGYSKYQVGEALGEIN